MKLLGRMLEAMGRLQVAPRTGARIETPAARWRRR